MSLQGSRSPHAGVVVDPARPDLRQPFAPARTVGGLVYVSGQASVDEHGAYVPGDFETEMRASIEALERVLAAAGCTLADVVQTRCYLGTFEYREQFNDLYLTFFHDPLPARTTTAGCIGPLKFEIDAIAAQPNGLT